MFQNILTFFKNAITFLGGDLKQAVVAAEPSAVTAFDGLVQKYTPVAVAQAKAAETQFTTGQEKASFVATQLSQQLQTDGHNVEADGFTAFINLLVEIGANFVKVLAGQALSATGASQ